MRNKLITIAAALLLSACSIDGVGFDVEEAKKECAEAGGVWSETGGPGSHFSGFKFPGCKYN